MNVYDLIKRLLDELDGSIEIFNIMIGHDTILIYTSDNKIIAFRKQLKAK